MGVEEIVLLLATQQLGQATAAYLTKIGTSVTSPFAKAAISVGLQLSANVVKGCTAGLVAANAEFTASNAQEKTAVAALNALPPIS